jgi:hypothetical protein
MTKRELTFHAAFLALSLALASAIAELGYRVYLKAGEGKDDGKPKFTAYSSSIWQYDRKLGYTYKPSARMDWVMVEDGLVQRCGTKTTAADGTSGRGPAGTKAAVDIAVLGDSFTAAVQDGVSWPDLLADELQRANPSLSLRIRNLSRDGYGVLQMVDQAADLLAAGKTRPDILIVAIIGPDLRRLRVWRREKQGPVHPELYYSFDPDMPEHPETYGRAALINGKVTRQWCESLLASKNTADGLLAEIAEQYKSARASDEVFSGKRVDMLSLSSCYLCRKIRTGSPYRPAAGLIQSGGIAIDRYSRDPDFVRNIDAIRAAGIPIWLAYLPWEPELRSGNKALQPREMELLKDLQRYVDRFFDLTPAQGLGDEATRLTMLPVDAHPSLKGLEYYASGMAKEILPAVSDSARRAASR